MAIYITKVRITQDIAQAFKAYGQTYPIEVFQALHDYLDEQVGEFDFTFFIDDIVASGVVAHTTFTPDAELDKFLEDLEFTPSLVDRL